MDHVVRCAPVLRASALASNRARSLPLPVNSAAGRNSARAYFVRPSFSGRSPRSVGNRHESLRRALQRVGDGAALRWSKRHADRHRAVDFEQLTPRRIGAFAFAVVALGAICLGYQS